MIRTIIGVVYLAAGAYFAHNHHYFQHLGGWHGIVSLILAIILWPLLLVGIDLHVRHTPRVKGSLGTIQMLVVSLPAALRAPSRGLFRRLDRSPGGAGRRLT